MRISVRDGHFKHASQAHEEIASLGLYAVEMTVPPVRNGSHWHRFSTRIYILEGELNITDWSRKVTFRAGPGALVRVPERVLHSEESAGGYSIVAGMTTDPATLTAPVDLDPGLL